MTSATPTHHRDIWAEIYCPVVGIDTPPIEAILRAHNRYHTNTRTHYLIFWSFFYTKTLLFHEESHTMMFLYYIFFMYVSGRVFRTRENIMTLCTLKTVTWFPASRIDSVTLFYLRLEGSSSTCWWGLLCTWLHRDHTVLFH